MVIFRSKKGGWTMGLDGTTFLENVRKTESVPLTGWTCWDGEKFIDDPHLRIPYDQPLTCEEITIKASPRETL